MVPVTVYMHIYNCGEGTGRQSYKPILLKFLNVHLSPCTYTLLFYYKEHVSYIMVKFRLFAEPSTELWNWFHSFHQCNFICSHDHIVLPFTLTYCSISSEFKSSTCVSPQPSFDPSQKPEQGILKSPALGASPQLKKKVPKKRRSQAADFFWWPRMFLDLVLLLWSLVIWDCHARVLELCRLLSDPISCHNINLILANLNFNVAQCNDLLCILFLMRSRCKYFP